MSLSARIAARQTCLNAHCDRPPAFPGREWCDPCYQGLLHTGRLPVIEAVFVPEWRKNLPARDETGRLIA